MSHRNDDKRTVLDADHLPVPHPEQIDDLEDLFHLGPQDNDGWLDFFLANGATSEEYNDAAYEYLVGQGITAGALPDMWAEFWAGGGPGPAVPPNALVDRDGNPILDRDGNYIIVD